MLFNSFVYQQKHDVIVVAVCSSLLPTALHIFIASLSLWVIEYAVASIISCGSDCSFRKIDANHTLVIEISHELIELQF